jgi:hypothetical protein
LAARRRRAARAQEQAFKSQGRAVEHVARRQHRRQQRRARQPAGLIPGFGSAQRHRQFRNQARQQKRDERAVRRAPLVIPGFGQARSTPGFKKQARELAIVSRSGGDFPAKPSTLSAAGLGAFADRLLSGKATQKAVAAAANWAGRQLFAATEISHLPGITPETKETLQHAGRDVIDIPANAIPSLYLPIKKSLTGHESEAVKMLTDPFVQTAKHPIKSFIAHPVGTALIVRGGEGAIGHGLGKTLRTLPSETTRRIGSTERRPAIVPGTALRQDRKFSKDVLVKAAQVARDRRVRTKHGDVRVMTPHEVRRRVDETFGADEDVRRVQRSHAVHAAQEALTVRVPRRERVRGRVKPTAATALVAQNITRTTREDLLAYRAELEHAGRGMRGAKRKANREAIRQIDKALRSHHPGAVEVAARRYAEQVSKPQQRKLAALGIVSEQQAERAALIPYAVRNMGARHDAEVGLYLEREVSPKQRASMIARLEDQASRLRAVSDHQRRQLGHPNPSLLSQAKEARREAERLREGGTLRIPLSNEEIRAHMAAHGVSEPAFVTQQPGARGARNFFVATHRPPDAGPGGRTGAAVREGTFDIHPDTLVEQSARAQGLITAADRFSRFVGEFAARDAEGTIRSFKGYRDAKQIADDMTAEGVPMRPVRINPLRGTTAQLESLLERADDVNHPAYKELHDAMDAALAGTGTSGPGSWAVIPLDAAEQARHHISLMGPGAPGRVARIYGSMFRNTVLALNPRWLRGNVVEAAMRSLVAHAGPRSYLTGRRALSELEKIDPGAALEARVRTIPGGHYSLSGRMNIHTNAEHFAGTRLAGVATALGKLRRTPGPKQVVDLWHAYTDFVFNTLNGRIESQFQTAMLGKALRDHPLMSERTVKLSRRAISDAARGMTDVNTVAALGREVDRMYGKYGKFSPGLKRMVQTYTPFIAWTINATRFVLQELPVNHPVATALIASANQATEKWRRQHGLRMFVEGAAPGWLQGSIPVRGGGRVRWVTQSTPFGLAGSPAENYAGTLLPQISGAWKALDAGTDWKGTRLPTEGTPNEEPGRWLAAAQSLLESSIPGVDTGQTIFSGEGTVLSRLGKRYTPFPVTRPRPRSTSGSSSFGSGFGGTSGFGGSSSFGSGSASGF